MIIILLKEAQERLDYEQIKRDACTVNLTKGSERKKIKIVNINR